jgi:hypothetical protein
VEYKGQLVICGGYGLVSSHKVQYSTLVTDRKEDQIFLIYKEIQNGAVAKSYII